MRPKGIQAWWRVWDSRLSPEASRVGVELCFGLQVLLQVGYNLVIMSGLEVMEDLHG